jgi:hypothetical protein
MALCRWPRGAGVVANEIVATVIGPPGGDALKI